MIYFIDLFGTFVFAISGVLAGIKNKFDLLGALIIGMVTAIGGGTLRDLLIGETPVGWMRDSNYLVAIVLALPICYLFRDFVLRLRKSMFLFDTIGIGLFTVLGLQKSLALELSYPVCILMGAVSAVFGGVMRDVLCNEVPLIFRKEIYASACLLGGLVYTALYHFGTAEDLNLIISMMVVSFVRYIAVKNSWTLNIKPRG